MKKNKSKTKLKNKPKRKSEKLQTPPKKAGPEKQIYRRLEASVTGRVQLVMYRDFVCRNARKRGLVGTVKNLRNGAVEVVAEGKLEELEAFSERLYDGPPLALVKDVEVKWKDANAEESAYENFRIVYS